MPCQRHFYLVDDEALQLYVMSRDMVDGMAGKMQVIKLAVSADVKSNLTTKAWSCRSDIYWQLRANNMQGSLWAGAFVSMVLQCW